MPDVAELEVPTLAYDDPALTGPAFHEVMHDLRERHWLARADPIGWFVLDREAAAFFLGRRKRRSPAASCWRSRASTAARCTSA